jgi:hypothetical protein
LRGDECGFFKFKPRDELEAIWREHGDSEKMFYRRGMLFGPITLDDLERRENAWLGTGEGSEYSGDSFFIHEHYSDEEKQTLWQERGDKDLFRWAPGMYRPEAIAA